MTGSRLAAHARNLEHERAAHRAVVASFDTVPEASRQTPGYHRAVDRFAHVLVARDVWLARLTGATPPREMFPTGSDPAGLASDADRSFQAWSSYLRGLSEAGLDAPVRYGSTEGARYESTVDEVLTHVYTHGFYHRGQVAQLIAAAGGTPAVQDLIVHTRRPA